MASLLLSLLCFSSLFLRFLLCSAAADFISGDQYLSGNQKLISKGGKFVLGFFPLGKLTLRFYIGIWYNTNKVSIHTPVWVANRASPILNPSSSELRISENGDLVLLDHSKTLIWSTGTRITSNSTIAILLDTGNLVLRDGSNASRLLWQSMEHPTNTWLPGGNLGLNKLTGESQRLIAWRDSEDPAPGLFFLELDPNGSSQYFILWNGTKRYWSSGAWNQNIFRGVPEMTENYIFDFEYVSNDLENHFTYSVNSDNIISRFIIDVSGQIKQLTWIPSAQQWILFWSQPRSQCEVYAICGAFGRCNEDKLPFCDCIRGFSKRSQEGWDFGDQSGGCVRNTPLQCGGNSFEAKRMDKFHQMGVMRFPANPQTVEATSVSECESVCLKNCSCTAYSYDGECSLWFGGLLNIQDQNDKGDQAGTLFVRLASSELSSSLSNNEGIVGVAVVCVLAFLAFLAIVWAIIFRWGRRRIMDATKAVADGSLVAFRYRDLQLVTKNFSDQLGSGGFGSVYKGVLPDSTIIAVKKLQEFSQGEKQFRNEVSTIGTIQHINLIHLSGFCVEGKNRCLVYEFMPKRSLDTHLFHGKTTNLDWGKRYHIALGTARGLAYLHEECRDCIIHCDIKPENILLDDLFVPKVADFGLAKLIGRDLSRVLTTVRGTRGYLAPEWIFGVAITAKTDVYSYGMMLFEIISGKRNIDHLEDNKPGFFPAFAVRNLMTGDVLSLLDPRLEGAVAIEQVTRAFKVACWCIQDEEISRPTMGQIVQMLEGIIEISMPPVPKSLQIYLGHQERVIFFSNSSINQSVHIQSIVSSSFGIGSSNSAS